MEPYTYETSIVLEELYDARIIFLRNEDCGVGNHVKTIEEMQEEGPLNDAASLIGQFRPMTRWNPEPRYS